MKKQTCIAALLFTGLGLFSMISKACEPIFGPDQNGQQQLQGYDPICMAAEQAAADQALSERLKRVAIRRAEMDQEMSADYWGAVIINLNSGDWYKTYNYATLEEAKSKLSSLCTSGACTPVAYYKNTCVAQAMGNKGEVFWAENVKPALAKQKAKNTCESKAKGCETSDQHIACSGFDYTDRNTQEVSTGQKSLSSMWKQYRYKGSLMGILLPKVISGRPSIGKSDVIFNPVAVQLSEQPLVVKQTINLPELLSNLNHPNNRSKVPDLYVSTALSKAGRFSKTYFGLTPAIAENEAMTRCGKSDCYILLTFKKGLCAAQSWGRYSNHDNYDYMVAAKTENDAKKLALDSCKKNAGNECQIAQSFCPNSELNIK